MALGADDVYIHGTEGLECLVNITAMEVTASTGSSGARTNHLFFTPGQIEGKSGCIQFVPAEVAKAAFEDRKGFLKRVSFKKGTEILSEARKLIKLRPNQSDVVREAYRKVTADLIDPPAAKQAHETAVKRMHGYIKDKWMVDVSDIKDLRKLQVILDTGRVGDEDELDAVIAAQDAEFEARAAVESEHDLRVMLAAKLRKEGVKVVGTPSLETLRKLEADNSAKLAEV